MSRTIYQEGQGFGQSEVVAPDEQFTEEGVRRAALELLTGPSQFLDDSTVIVSAEWDRKGYLQRGPIDETNSSYRRYPESDDLIVSIEFRLSGYQRESEASQQLQREVRKVIKQREEARLAAQIEQAAAEAAAAKAALDAAELKLAELRAQ